MFCSLLVCFVRYWYVLSLSTMFTTSVLYIWWVATYLVREESPKGRVKPPTIRMCLDILSLKVDVK